MSDDLITFHRNTAWTPILYTEASRSCLQKLHAQACCCILLKSSICLLRRLDFSSTYNHRETTGIPNAKKMIIVRMGTRKTNNDNPKSNVPMPRVTSHRFVRLPPIDKLSSLPHLLDIWHFLLFVFFCFSFFRYLLS